MTTPDILRYGRWSAYLSAAATILLVVTGILFLMIPQFGIATDVSSVLQAVFMIPVALAVYVLLRPHAPGLALAAMIIGILGMLVTAVLQSLLVAGIRTYQQVGATVIDAGAAVGIWLLLSSFAARRGGAFPRGLIRLGMIVGAGYLVMVAGFRAGELESPLFYVGSVIANFGYPVWAIWLARRVLTEPRAEFQTS